MPKTDILARIQVLGICRFSVPSSGAFQVEHDTIEDRRAALYDPARLATRFLWFERVLLPGISTQTTKDFRLIVLLGEDFPEPWHARMQALVQGVPQIVLEYAKPEHHRQVCALAMQRHVEKKADAVAQFRLDDDDAVAINFVDELRREVAAQAQLFQRTGLLAIDQGKGVVLRTSNQGVSVEPCVTQFWTPGLAIVTKASTEKFVLDYPHHRVWRQMATVSLVSQIMFVRGAHGGNDSHIPPQKEGYRLLPEAVGTVLMQRFAIDLPGFAAALAGAAKVAGP